MPTKRYMNRGASRMSSHIVSSKRYSASNAKRGGAPARPEYRPPAPATSSTKRDTRAGAAKPIGRQVRLQRRLQSRGDAECATHRAGRPTCRPRPPQTRLPARESGGIQTATARSPESRVRRDLGHMPGLGPTRRWLRGGQGRVTLDPLWRTRSDHCSSHHPATRPGARTSLGQIATIRRISCRGQRECH